MNTTPKHLYSLDALRGIAAIAVVIFHYANFMTVGDVLPPEFVRDALPFHKYLALIHDKGWLAVDLFFTLSGFVFFWLYSERIHDREITPGRFFMLRFSRLYPLHFATLVLVLGLQLMYTINHANPPYFLVKVNDMPHFMLHLFFASNWLPWFGFTFNSPVWSVSVEVLLYIAFFAFCRITRPRVIVMAALSVIGWWLIYRFHTQVGRGIGSFFAGGLALLAYRRLLDTPKRNAWLWSLTTLAMLAWAFGLYGISRQWDFVPASLTNRTRYFPVAVMFPVTVLVLALWETTTGFGKPLAWLGDMSYSTYLLHFPLQLVFVLVSDAFGIDRSTYYSPWAFVLFFAVLLPLASACYHYFERPMQSAIRRLEPRMVSRQAA